MTDQRPDWANAVSTAVQAMGKQTPIPLMPALRMFGGADAATLDEQEFGTFLTQATENDAALTALRLALASWDAAPEAIRSADGDVLPPRSDERCTRIYELLDLSEWL